MPLSVSFDYNFSGDIPPLVDGDHKSTVKLTSYMQNDKRRVSMPPKDCSAVEVRRLRYVVGRRKKAKVILSGINMTVPEGAIYGLLGPSGSGKTTLLKSVVGQLTPTEGWVKVFGFQPNQPGSQIPGSAIGYMPQELAVYEDFTIKETLWYFGRLYRIPSRVIKERIEFLLTFLDLPRSKRLIVNMSGGQKRRVSLASALVHSPPLLILDEPTVGVDPLLRQSIWQHLVTLTQTEKITVIVTTHYIEEARRANIVGLMRRGKLLAENAPDDLMAKHDSSSLEDVFLKLCVSDTMRRAQKFASLTGMPLGHHHQAAAAALTGTNSVIPTPEIQAAAAGAAKQRLGVGGHGLEDDDANCTGVVVAVVAGGGGTNTTTTTTTTTTLTSNSSGDVSGASSSQSPDEGVNTNNSDSSASGDSSNGSEHEHAILGQDKSPVAPQTDHDHRVVGGRGSSPDLSATSTANHGQHTGNSLGLSPMHQDASNKLAHAGNGAYAAAASVEAKSAPNLVPAAQAKPAGLSRFKLKALLKSLASGPASRLDDDDNNNDGQRQQDHQPSVAELKAAERRRQSGSYFIEQLISKANQQQQQYELTHGARPAVNQLLSCDTTKQQHQQHQHLDIPKISVRGSYGDSGASSNGSSQNHSPIGRGGEANNLSNTNSNTNSGNNLISAAYANHSYQASECGSTAFNDLALIASNTCLGLAHNKSSAQQVLYNQPHEPVHPASANMDLDDLDDDIILDPKLFMNPADLSTMSPGNKYDYKQQSCREYCDTVGTITWKNYIRLKRNVPLLLFQFVLPAIQVILFCICVGNDPFDIPVAVVNEESSAADSIAALSTQFLRSVDSHLVRQVNYSNLQEAIASVRTGQNWGVIHIPENFTISIHRRFAGLEAGELDDATLENSTIKVYPDMTNQPIGHAMEVAFRRAYNDLSKQTFEFLGLNPALSDPPIRMEGAIYGKIDMQNYLQYMSPGVLISISYIMATGLTSLAFIIERRDGLYDRTLAAGVDHVQMLLSHAIVQLLVMIVQISLVVFFTFVIYKVPTNGPFVWVFLLLLLQGLAGMSFGLMVSAICKEENTAIMMILGTFYPNLLLAGVIWPIEAIPHWLRWFSYLQPQTLPTQSLRDLIVRGWDIDQPGVWSGFAVTSIWLLLFLAISCVAFKVRK